MLQINNETAHAMFYKLMERFDKIEKMLERQNKNFFEQKGLPLPASMRNNPNV